MSKLNSDPLIKAYIVSLLEKYKNSSADLSKKSITLEYAQAKQTANFQQFQDLGDWVFITGALFTENIKSSQEYYISLGQLSYYACYRLVRSWKIYEEMADQLSHLILETKKILKS